jgi:hypothetical protein
MSENSPIRRLPGWRNFESKSQAVANRPTAASSSTASGRSLKSDGAATGRSEPKGETVYPHAACQAGRQTAAVRVLDELDNAMFKLARNPCIAVAAPPEAHDKLIIPRRGIFQ